MTALQIYLWLMAGLVAANALGTVVIVGKPREPMKPSTAAWHVAFQAILVVLLVLAARR